MNDEPITQARIDELKATTAHCVWSDLFTKADDAPPPELLTTIDAYLSRFVKYAPKCPCVNCGNNQSDGLITALMGGFTWGLIHGEGHCEFCGWPARAYHVIPAPDGGEPIAKFNLVLQYHPEALKAKARAA